MNSNVVKNWKPEEMETISIIDLDHTVTDILKCVVENNSDYREDDEINWENVAYIMQMHKKVAPSNWKKIYEQISNTENLETYLVFEDISSQYMSLNNEQMKGDLLCVVIAEDIDSALEYAEAKVKRDKYIVVQIDTTLPSVIEIPKNKPNKEVN